MMADKQLAPEQGASKLPQLLYRSLFDADLKRLLFEEPQLAVERFDLDEDDQQRMMRASWSDLEYAVGRVVRYKLMPVQVGQRVWISPQPGNGNGGSDRVEIYLDQSATGAKIGPDGVSNRKGVVFGSGTHPTTRLCVLLLEKCVRPGMRVLDLGTGSGILSIAAAKLGAREVFGLDIDSEAVQAAHANLLRNGLNGSVRMQTGDVEWLRSNRVGSFDLIVANILANIHMQSIQDGLLENLSPGGQVIFSGMHRPGAQCVAQELYEAGAPKVEYTRMGSWFALKAKFGDGG
jgi:ribosomal protein L11 methyltransferase